MLGSYIEQTEIKMIASVTLVTQKWEMIYPNYPVCCFYKFPGFLYPCIILTAKA
jgi:hypothetical protein